MVTKEELEIQKLQIEIEQIKEPFWKKPNIVISVVTIIITAAIGFNSYFVKVNQDNVDRIKQLEAKTKESETLLTEIRLEKIGLEKTQIENKANASQQKYEATAEKLNEQEQKIEQNTQKLIKLNSSLKNEQTRYELYKKKVKQVTQYMADYGPGYADGIVNSVAGMTKLREIATLPIAEERIKEMKIFTMNVVNQTFQKSIDQKENQLGFTDSIGNNFR